MPVEQLRPQVLRLRKAAADLDRAQRALATAETEYTAARQELDDALISTTDGIR